MDKKKILVADDEPHLVRSLSFILGKEGYDVLTATDGEEALAAALQHKPDLMVLDLMMPKKNGYEVCQEIRKVPELKATYIIVLSAKGWDADTERALILGANEFISKPFSPAEIVNKIKELMR
jgi:DNA-binding response OmpR family regulator